MRKYKLDFFLPFEFDQVPKDWDPWKDTWDDSKGKLFIWDCFENLPFDGLLISKSKFDENSNRFSSILRQHSKIKDAFHIPKHIKLFGDCGAFQYRNENSPPYSESDVLNYYQEHGFDMGCSIDHIIVDKNDEKQRERRYEITKNYALKCLDLYDNSNFDFELFGVAQGWDIKSYENMVKFLINIGYKNLCIGGLVGLNKRKARNDDELTIENLITRLKPLFSKFNNVHIFGRGNIEYLPLFIETGVTQFDNNVQRKSWTDEKRSYFFYDNTLDHMKYYTSIRLPLTMNSKGKNKIDLEIFDALKRFCEEKKDVNEILSELTTFYDNYNKLNKKEFKVNEDLIKLLLSDKPWRKCECDVCKKYEMHVAVFRRRMRNMIRGFHNVYNYYSLIKNIRGGVLKH